MKHHCWAALLLLGFTQTASAARPPKPPKTNPKAPILSPDVLLDARASLRAGAYDAAATAALATGTPHGALLAGIALTALGRHQDAADALAKVPQGHPLWEQAAQRRVGALRRAQAWDGAKTLLREMHKRGLLVAAYLEADVELARAGCAAVVLYRKALAQSAQHPARHAARRALLTCATTPSDRATLALDMLEDAEPVDAVRGRAVLQDVVDHPDEARPVDKALAYRMADRLLMERLPALTAAVVDRLPRTPDAEELLRRQLLLASALGAMGKREDKRKLLDEIMASRLGQSSPGVWRSVLAAHASDLQPKELAVKNIEIAEKFPDDPMAIENRHLAGYYFAEAGDLTLALAQWEQVAAAPNAKQKDAAWFVARTLAGLGRLGEASQRALAWARPSAVGVERATHFRYWSGQWARQSGKSENGNADLAVLCTTFPARLYGRLACARVGAPAPAVPVSPPELPVDAAPALVELATAKSSPLDVKTTFTRAAMLYQAGAWDAAREVVRTAVARARGSDALLLSLGEAALAVGEPWAAVLLAERNRARVDAMTDGRWLRLAHPRVVAVENAAASVGLDPDLALAIARTESYFAPMVRSKAGAMGLMQLMPTTAQQLWRQGDPDLLEGALFDPEVNAVFGTRYLKMLWDDFGGRVELVAAAYNSGPTNARRFVERGRGLQLDAFMDAINFRETRGYVKRVLEAYLNYRAARGLPAVVDLERGMDVVPGDSVKF